MRTIVRMISHTHSQFFSCNMSKHARRKIDVHDIANILKVIKCGVVVAISLEGRGLRALNMDKDFPADRAMNDYLALFDDVAPRPLRVKIEKHKDHCSIRCDVDDFFGIEFKKVSVRVSLDPARIAPACDILRTNFHHCMYQTIKMSNSFPLYNPFKHTKFRSDPDRLCPKLKTGNKKTWRRKLSAAHAAKK